MSQEHQLLRQSSLLLDSFASLIGHRFDPQRAERILYESHLNESSKPYEDWLDTVTSCADALEFRIRRVDASIDEIISLVKSGVPAAILLSAEEGLDNWFLVSKCYRARVQLLSLESGKSEWISAKQLIEKFRLESTKIPTAWLVCYPILMRDASNATETEPTLHEHGDPHFLTPFRRFLGLLRAESSDIFVIIVFSIVVGLLTLTTPIAVEAVAHLGIDLIGQTLFLPSSRQRLMCDFNLRDGQPFNLLAGLRSQ